MIGLLFTSVVDLPPAQRLLILLACSGLVAWAGSMLEDRKLDEKDAVAIVAALAAALGGTDLLLEVWSSGQDERQLRLLWLGIIGMGLFVAAFRIMWKGCVRRRLRTRRARRLPPHGEGAR